MVLLECPKGRIPGKQTTLLVKQHDEEARGFEERFDPILSKEGGEWVQCTPLRSARPAPPELALEHIHREVDHGRSAVRTGARRLTGFQVDQQGALLFVG